jgi:hypothetical protein
MSEIRGNTNTTSEYPLGGIFLGQNTAVLAKYEILPKSSRQVKKCIPAGQNTQ